MAPCYKYYTYEWRNLSLSKACIAGQHYQYMLVFFLEWNRRTFNEILKAEDAEPIRTIAEAMRVKAWNDVTIPTLLFARSCYKRCSL